MTLRRLTDRFAGRPLEAHIIRTHWPTLLNPMTDAGMLRLGGIVGRVVSARTSAVPPALTRSTPRSISTGFGVSVQLISRCS
jgi:hypothetical protein